MLLGLCWHVFFCIEVSCNHSDASGGLNMAMKSVAIGVMVAERFGRGGEEFVRWSIVGQISREVRIVRVVPIRRKKFSDQ